MPPTKPAKSPKRRGPGRPPTEVEWKGISTRFTIPEKRRLKVASQSVGLSQAELIREGALRLVETVEKDKKIQLTARPV